MNTSKILKKTVIFFITAILLITATFPARISSEAADGNLIIMLDPGHGGRDGGAENTVNGVYYNENILMMKVANYVKAELSQYPGVTVLMTRESTETYLTLAERVSKATGSGAHAIISIHANSYSQSSVNGAEALVAYGNYRPDIAAETKNLGTKILSQLHSIGLKNRGLKTGFDNQGEHIAYYPDGSLQDYYGIVQRALRGGIPGIIIETAFISNSTDVTNHFSSNEKLERLGKAIATGIAKHYELSKDTKASATVRPHIDAHSLTFSGNPDTSFLYGQNGTKVTQSNGYATLTQSSGKIQVYLDYRGMAFSADTYKYAVIRMRTASEDVHTIINTGAYEISYDDPAFTYTATLGPDFKNILLDMSGNEAWTLGVNFIKIQISGTPSADIEYVKFYETKASAENGIDAIRPTFAPTQKPTTNPTAELTPVSTLNQTPQKTKNPTPTQKTTSNIIESSKPTQPPVTETTKPISTPTQSATSSNTVPTVKEKSSKPITAIVISILILVTATAILIIILLNQLKKH